MKGDGEKYKHVNSISMKPKDYELNITKNNSSLKVPGYEFSVASDSVNIFKTKTLEKFHAVCD